MASQTNTRYHYPLGLLLQVGLDALLGRSRSFRQDAVKLAAQIDPPLQVLGLEHIPKIDDFIVTTNHYAHPGFNTWWLALVVSALVERDIHWIMTEAWTFEGRWYAGLLRPLTRWGLFRIAHLYGFTTMRPYNQKAQLPQPDEIRQGAEALRRVFAVARRNPRPAIGFSPEGKDSQGGVLGWPPYGAGRFVYHLNQLGYAILPVGIYEENGRLQVRFGPAYSLGESHSHSSDNVHPNTFRLLAQRQIDLLRNRTVMRRIAILLPERLRGEFK
jgi:hypothetical protein